jgi:hypothetical protein
LAVLAPYDSKTVVDGAALGASEFVVEAHDWVYSSVRCYCRKEDADLILLVVVDLLLAVVMLYFRALSGNKIDVVKLDFDT